MDWKSGPFDGNAGLPGQRCEKGFETLKVSGHEERILHPGLSGDNENFRRRVVGYRLLVDRRDILELQLFLVAPAVEIEHFLTGNPYGIAVLAVLADKAGIVVVRRSESDGRQDDQKRGFPQASQIDPVGELAVPEKNSPSGSEKQHAEHPGDGKVGVHPPGRIGHGVVENLGHGVGLDLLKNILLK